MESILSNLLLIAWLLPLASFCVILFFGPRLGVAGRGAAYVATGAIGGGFVLSLIALLTWIGSHGVAGGHHPDAAEASHASLSQHSQQELVHFVAASKDSHGHDDAHHGHGHAHDSGPKEAYFGDWYTLVDFGRLKITIGYYIDALTVLMFTMVTLIASCIHFYAMGYMHEELHDVTDHEVTLSNGEHLHRKGRYYRFFQYLSLFCFSMLGIVIAGNIAMTFVFWELVGICSYFLIGFYIE